MPVVDNVIINAAAANLLVIIPLHSDLAFTNISMCSVPITGKRILAKIRVHAQDYLQQLTMPDPIHAHYSS